MNRDKAALYDALLSGDPEQLAAFREERAEAEFSDQHPDVARAFTHRSIHQEEEDLNV